MRTVIQRVYKSSVIIDREVYSSIEEGLLVLLGIKKGDTDSDISYILDKILNLRIFNDANGKMNLSIQDISGELLIVSQFTLYGDARKGRRPSYDTAGDSISARLIYEKFIDELKDIYDENKIKTGCFGADMKVELCNNGPVTILLDSERIF